MKILILIMLLASPFGAEARKKIVDAKPPKGDVLEKQGWKRIADCDDGHNWSYVLEKNGERRYCQGWTGYAERSEDPCVPFVSDLGTFKALSAKAKMKKDEYQDSTEESRQNSPNANAQCADGNDKRK